MNTNTIYDAVSGFDEKYILAADNTDAISLSFRKHKNHKLKVVETLCACAALVIATGWISSQSWFGKNPVIAQSTTAVSNNTTQTDPQRMEQTLYQAITSKTEKYTQICTTDNPNWQEHSEQAPYQTTSRTEKYTQTYTTGNPNQQEHNEQTSQVDVPSTTKISEKPIAPYVEPSSAVATTIVNNEEQQSVYNDVIVKYDTAKKYFNHPIIPCDRSDFTGYNVLLVSPKENNNESETECLSITYLFKNGSVDLRDQNKTGKVTPTGKEHEYRGKTFYVHTPEFNGDNIRIGYYPTGENGIAYQAHFNSRSDINEIMDLILTLEIKE
ncbi:MAG: hypothetical protein IJA02_03255 [Clostridia bacterium]|nr:hypothetical protein [Clostridia bacterium]